MSEMNAEEKTRFDRMEEHIKFIQRDLADILSALRGNQANGNTGMVHEIKDIKDRLVEQEVKLRHLTEESIRNKQVIKILEWVLGFVTAVAGGTILIFLNSKK